MSHQHPILNNPRLSPAVKVELIDLQDYIASHTNPDGTMRRLPEGSMAALMNRASPEARAFMAQNREFVENFHESGGREMPFEPKRYLDENKLPPPARAAMQQAHDEDITHRLNQRMGTPTADTSPPTTRDYLSAAFDHHEGADHD